MSKHKVYCDNCGKRIHKACPINTLPMDIKSANKGESAMLCTVCYKSVSKVHTGNELYNDVCWNWAFFMPMDKVVKYHYTHRDFVRQVIKMYRYAKVRRDCATCMYWHMHCPFPTGETGCYLDT